MGGSGSLADTYLNTAKKLIDLIWQYEVDHALGDVLMPGDQFGGGQIINISAFRPRVLPPVRESDRQNNRVDPRRGIELSASSPRP